MPEYRVVWEVDVDADSPAAAAEQAFAMMQDPDTTATCFTVTDAATGKAYEADLKFDDQRTAVRDKDTGELSYYNL